MLQKLSYFNLLLAIIYLLAYLRSGTFYSTSGILVVIVFNWLYLLSFERNAYQWKIWHYLIASWVIYFVATTLYSLIGIISAAIEYDFIATDTLTFILLSVIFGICVLTQLIWYYLQNVSCSK